MVGLILLFLIVFWLLGYGPFALFDATLLNLNGNLITIWDLLIFGVIVWAIGVLPSPLRQIVGIIFVLWILSTLGIFSIFAFAGLSQLLVIVIIVAVIISLF